MRWPSSHELAEINENLIRRNLLPSEETLAIRRRAELILRQQQIRKEQEAGSAVNTLTPPKSRQAQRGSGLKTGTEPASARDLARNFLRSHEYAAKTIKRAKALDDKTLEDVKGNRIAFDRITHPREIEKLYSALPLNKLDR